MILTKKDFYLGLVISSALVLAGCGPIVTKNKNVQFSNDDQIADQITPYVDKFASEPIKITQNHRLNEEFTVKYKTSEPSGEGTATFKAKSIKEIPSAGKRTPENGKKLILVEIAVRGNRNNRGNPSTFNQVGDTPSPQFVIIDKSKNKSFVEETYYSDGYTVDKKLFELSKITLDSDQWVDTAIVFQIDQKQDSTLAFRFVNLEGETEFYGISQ